MGLILVETLNDLDAFHRKEASFFVRSPLLCEKSFSSSGIIPNFCLGSQPSEIPLTLQPFNFQLIEAPYIVFHYHLFFSTHALFFFLCFPSLSLSLFFFFFQIQLQERLQLLQPFIVPPSTYLFRHFRDRWLHQNDMSFEAYTELMGHIKEIDIQWVVAHLKHDSLLLEGLLYALNQTSLMRILLYLLYHKVIWRASRSS